VLVSNIEILCKCSSICKIRVVHNTTLHTFKMHVIGCQNSYSSLNSYWYDVYNGVTCKEISSFIVL